MNTAENLGFVVARSNANGLIFDLRHTPSFISSSRFAAYREILCPAASRYAPDLRPGLLEVKALRVITHCGWYKLVARS